MRWDDLFADLEGQLEDGLDSEARETEVEEERLRVGRATLRDRIAAFSSTGTAVATRLRDGTAVDLVVRTVGRDWISGDLAGTASQAVVPLPAVVAVLPTRQQLTLPPPAARGALTDRIGLAYVLRDLARRRRRVTLLTAAGPVTGTLDRVGRDHVDLAVHAADEWRRATSVQRIEVLALAALLLVRVD